MATKMLSASCRRNLLGGTAQLGMHLRLGQQSQQFRQLFGTAFKRTAATAAAKTAAAETPVASRAGSLSSRASRPSSSSSSSSSPLRSYVMAAVLPLAMFSLDNTRLVPEAAQEARRPSPGYQLPLDAEFAAQISKGSFSGFLIGLLVSMFSRTLVFLVGVAITFQSVAARLGVDLVQILKLKERVNSSKILTALSRNTAFKLAFGITFTLAAFARF